MRVSQILSGSKVVFYRMQIGISVDRIGVPMVQPGAGNAGIVLGTTTACDNMVGLAHSTGTYATAQSGTADVSAAIDVIVNPDAIFEAKLSGGATDDTALTLRSVSAANTDGLVITTGDNWTSPQYDEGVIWGYDGGNPGKVRKITSTGTAAATVTVAFPVDSVVGDNYLYAPVAFPGGPQTVTLSTNLTQVRQDVAVATNTAAFRCLELLLRDQGQDGRTNSYIRMLSGNHVFGGVLN